MKGPEILEDNLKAARVTHDDLREKLREANVIQRKHVKAVVFESTGAFSVIHHEDEDLQLDDLFLEDVRGWNPN